MPLPPPIFGGTCNQFCVSIAWRARPNSRKPPTSPKANVIARIVVGDGRSLWPDTAGSRTALGGLRATDGTGRMKQRGQQPHQGHPSRTATAIQLIVKHQVVSLACRSRGLRMPLLHACRLGLPDPFADSPNHQADLIDLQGRWLTGATIAARFHSSPYILRPSLPTAARKAEFIGAPSLFSSLAA